MEGMGKAERRNWAETPKERREELKRLLETHAEAAEKAPAHRLFEELKQELEARYADAERMPPVAEFILGHDTASLVRAFGFERDGRVAELSEGHRLAIDERGQLTLDAPAGGRVLMRAAADGPRVASLYHGPFREAA